MMPTFLGRPIYPGGAPIRPENIFFEGYRLDEIIQRYYNNSLKEGEAEIIKEYVLYYIHAPSFDLTEIEGNDLQSMNLEDLLDMLLDAGIDPL